MLVTRLSDKLNQLWDYREKGITKGKYCGFDCLDELLSLKKGSPIYIGGQPYSGKTEFLLEILVSSSELYGWRHFLYLGETGNETEIYAELCHKFIKKRYRLKNNRGVEDGCAMNHLEARSAETWVHEHFYIMPPEEHFTYEKFYKNIENVENQYSVKFDTTTIDPVIDLADLENTPEFLQPFLKRVQYESKKNNRIDILLFHCGKPKKEKKDGFWYSLPNDTDEWAGGQTPFRKAFQMILVYRPPVFPGLSPTEQDLLKNETHIIVQKSKPKGVGKTGTAKIYWDWMASRFYELTTMGTKRYSGKEQQKTWHNPHTGQFQDTKPLPESNQFPVAITNKVPDNWIEPTQDEDSLLF